ncbi:MAG: polysialyltransferase family glycosyltransferase [Brevinema sp.]
MTTMFFASNMFEILQVQNITTQLQLEKQKTYLILWLKNSQLFSKHTQYIDENLFSDVIFMQRPIWKNNPLNSHQMLLKSQNSLETLISVLHIDEIFVPDPEKEYQLLESICKKQEIKLSLYENGITTYRYLYSNDPNRRNFSFRWEAFKKNFYIFINQKRKQNIFSFFMLLLFDSFPEIGQLFFTKSIKNCLFRIKSFDRCLCINAEAANELFNIKSTQLLSVKHLISNKQQMSVYSSHEFWDIKPDYLMFIDQNYLIFGITPTQHAEIVIKCLETFGRVSDIMIKAFWNVPQEIIQYYQRIIASKKYKIHIIQTDVIAEVIIGTKKIRKIASLAGMSYVYSKMSSPEIRNYCFHRTYEEKAKEIGVSKDVLKKIKKFHDFFDQINPLFYDATNIEKNELLSNSFFNFTESS